MPDTPNIPPDNNNPPPDDSDSDKPRRPRKIIPEEWLTELSLAGEILTAARKADYAPTLAEEEVDDTYLTNFAAKLAATNNAVATYGRQATDAKTDTRTEEQKKEALLKLLGKAQSRAKRKFRTNPERRKVYYINQPIATRRPLLEAAALSILAAVAVDKIPGMTPARIAELQAASDAYKNAQGGQTNGKSVASSARTALEKEIEDIADTRKDIQYAADAAWPHTEKPNAPIRKEFKLPARRSLG